MTIPQVKPSKKRKDLGAKMSGSMQPVQQPVQPPPKPKS